MWSRWVLLYLIPFLHQTTTDKFSLRVQHCCILFHFYIKPQHFPIPEFDKLVVSYSISTSNHNRLSHWQCTLQVVSYSISTSNHNQLKGEELKLFVVSYSISTSNHNLVSVTLICSCVVSYSISTSNHNSWKTWFARRNVVSYSISTSNHNFVPVKSHERLLYLIPFLHQTTTYGA